MNGQDNEHDLTAIFVGFDVHKDTIATCVIDASTGEILLEQQLKNQPAAVAKLIKRIRRHFGEPRSCYEASSYGFVLFRQLRDLDVACDVIAPSSIPRRSGDRIKTDRRDAEKLAFRSMPPLIQMASLPMPMGISSRRT